METRTIMIDYAGPGKKNPAYGKVKSGEDWFDCSLDIANQLYKHKGKQVQVLVEQTPKGYWQIKGFPNAMQMGGQQYAPASVGQAASVVVANIAPPQGIGREEGMFAMAVIGKAFQGLGTIPAQQVLADAVYHAVLAWRDAELSLKEFASRTAPTTRPGPQEPPPFDDPVPF